MDNNKPQIQSLETLSGKIRISIILFMAVTICIGVTTFPLHWELGLIHSFSTHHCPDSEIKSWLNHVSNALDVTYASYPFMAYGTDWLAFAHIVIALSFIGPLHDPVRNIWVIEWGMLTSILVFPLAFIAGPIRMIPFFHQLIDASFGLFSFILLFCIHQWIRKLQKLNEPQY